jgi:excisionase family DNA binding protein
MTMSPYVTVREASQMLGVSEGKVMALVDEKKLQAYKIAGQYLRLKREDVAQMRSSGLVESETVKFAYTVQERFRDFLVYNDFYIMSFVIILALLYIIFFGG